MKRKREIERDKRKERERERGGGRERSDGEYILYVTLRKFTTLQLDSTLGDTTTQPVTNF